MIKRSHKILTGSAAMALALAAGNTFANGTPSMAPELEPGDTIQSVLDRGGSFRVADKVFHFDSFFSVAFSADEIAVTPLDFGLAGRGFRLADSWTDFPGDQLSSDFTLSYSVEIVDDPATPNIDESTYWIVDNRLIFDGFATGPGSFSRVDETVEDAFGAFVAEKSVFANGDGSSQFEDFVDLAALAPIGDPGFKKLNIVKDALFFAPTADGTAGASFIDQTFSQQIPTPGALGVFGVAGLVAVRRRR